MREILFRGKRLDNGRWVYGHFCVDAFGKSVILLDREFGNIEPDYHLVDPSTVGQYTELLDENGKRIFEGDVVRFMERRLGGKDVPVVEVVEFSEGGFATNRYFLNNWLRDIQKGNTQLQDIEVIGNIYDSELLEVNEDE